MFDASRLKDRASLLVVFKFASDAMLPRKVADEGKVIAFANLVKVAADRLSRAQMQVDATLCCVIQEELATDSGPV